MQRSTSCPPLIPNRRCNNLLDILVRAKNRRPPPQNTWSFCCNRSRWKTCPFYRRNHVLNLLLYLDEQRRIRHHISCSSSNLIYMIQYNECNMQYLGETERQLSDSFGEHRLGSIEKARNPHHFYHPTTVSDHFSPPDDFIKDIELFPLELIN